MLLAEKEKEIFKSAVRNVLSIVDKMVEDGVEGADGVRNILWKGAPKTALDAEIVRQAIVEGKLNRMLETRERLDEHMQEFLHVVRRAAIDAALAVFMGI